MLEPKFSNEYGKMKALITGGSGFIGKHLVRRLTEDGHLCRCLVRAGSDVNELRTLGVELVYGDILDPNSLNGVFRDIDIVYHLAAMGHVSAVSKEAYDKFKQINVIGTKNLAEACGKHNLIKFVHVSSTAAMGLIKDASVVDENTECQPTTPYQKSKRESEEIILSFWRKDNLPVVVIRPCMVYGPGGQGEFWKWCKLIKKGVFPRVGRGKNLTPMVHVDDVVQAAILAGKRGIPGETYLITSDDSFELDSIRQAVLEALSIKRFYPYVPTIIAKFGALGLESAAKLFRFSPIVTYRNIDSTATDRVFSISKAIKHLGYQPKTILQEGIGETVKWYVNNGFL